MENYPVVLGREYVGVVRTGQACFVKNFTSGWVGFSGLKIAAGVGSDRRWVANHGCHLGALVYAVALMFNSLKDSLSSSAAKSLLASRIDRYGKLTDLRIRSREKTISAELVLEGEEIPVTLRIERYRITGTSGEHSLVVEAVSASRPWLQNLLEDLLVGKPLPVPSILLLALGKPED